MRRLYPWMESRTLFTQSSVLIIIIQTESGGEMESRSSWLKLEIPLTDDSRLYRKAGNI